MFINSNKPISRRTSTCINFVSLGLQQMLKLATLGLRTRRGKSVNPPSASNQSIESIAYTAASSKMRLGTAARVCNFYWHTRSFMCPNRQKCVVLQSGCLDGLCCGPLRPIHHPRLWIRFLCNTKMSVHYVLFQHSA